MRLRPTLVTGLTALFLAAIFVAAWVGLARTTPTEWHAERIAATDTTAYALAGDTLTRALALGRIERTLEIAAAVSAPLLLWLLLSTRIAARLREITLRLARGIWTQGYLFALLLLTALRLLEFPLNLWGHNTALRYGLSVQAWASWFEDWGKGLALECAIGGLVAVVFMWIVRRTGRRWWIWFWAATCTLVIAGVFISPYVIDPIFNRFTPMQRTDPALVSQLQRVVARAGESIPPERMFIMQASAKSTQLNAYVTGFGASKRVVVWDTTIAHSSPDEIAFIFAHELGHYALGHVLLGTTITCLSLLPLFWLGDCASRMLIARFGATWRISSLDDWAGIVILALTLSLLSAIGEPIANAYSRAMEHDADVFGQEAVHGIIADPQAVGQNSFQVLGSSSLNDPTSHPIFEWWFDTHPTIRFRAAFARAYDPWAAGEQPSYFRP